MHYHLFLITTILALSLFSPTAARAEAEAERGAKVAKDLCSRCHIIGKNEFGGIASTMSFYMMSEHIDRYEIRLRSVTARRPHIALKLKLSDENIDELVAYIKKLDWRARWKRLRPRK